MAAKKNILMQTCVACETKKKLTDFYISYNEMFPNGRVPMCKECMFAKSVDSDGNIDLNNFKEMLRKIDRPYIEKVFNAALQETEHLRLEGVTRSRKIFGTYFKNINSLNQYKKMVYNDSDCINITTTKNSETILIKNDEEEKDCVITDKDRQNMEYSISTAGYDPFEDLNLTDLDRKYCFNIMAGYCDIDGVREDGHKLQCVIELVNSNLQCKKINEAINKEMLLSNPDDTKIKNLTATKTSLLSSIATIAKDNNIASNYNKNSKQGQNSLSSKMKEMEQAGYDAVKVNLYDIKTSAAFKQIADLSNQSISDQLTLDSNDFTEIIKEQREMLQKNERDIDDLKEENRNLKNKILDLENKQEKRL